MSLDAAFGFQSQQSRALAAIDSTKYPDTNIDLQQNLIRLNQFVDYIASYLQQMQKATDKNNQDPIAQIQGIASDLVVLLGGGELLYGIDLGDLQYFLPAIGALFGFDTSTPFPINLFNAVEHFFLGYVVPLDSFSTVIEGILDGLLEALGIDPAFIQSLNDLLDAIGSLTMSIEDLLTAAEQLIGILGTNFPFISQIWKTLTTILGGLNIAELGQITDPVFKNLAPWIEELATFVDYLAQIIEAFARGVQDIHGILNFSQFWSAVNFTPTGTFNPATALQGWVESTLKPTNLLAPLMPDANLSGGLPGFYVPMENLALTLIGDAIGSVQTVWDTILHSVGVPAGSGTQAETQTYFLNFLAMFSNPTLISGTFNPVTAVEDFLTNMAKPTNLLAPVMTSSGSSGGVTGFVPMENLDLTAIGSVLGSAQELTDAILATVGFPAGSGTATEVNKYFSDLLAMFYNPMLTDALFNPATAVNNFVQHMVIPGGLLAPLTAGGAAISGVTNLLPPVNVPGLDATKIISGVLAVAAIPLLPAAIIGSGIFNAAQIPGLDASKIISGVFSLSLIPNLPASIVTSGTFPPAQIPGLDATKIISGQFAQSMVNITNIPATIVSGTLTPANIPGLDATKITSGQFAQSMVNITNIPATIVSGTLLPSNIPGLDATKIVSGFFSQAQIPSLDASWPGTIVGSAIPDITTLINTSVGTTGGSTFPWNFPMGFGPAANTTANVGTAIANNNVLAQQVLDTVVHAYTGSTIKGNSIQQLHSALNQQPGTTLGGTKVPPAIIPDITPAMSSGIQTVQSATSGNTLDISNIINYAGQQSSQAVGSFISATGIQATTTQVFSQGSTDAIVGGFNGISIVGSTLDQLASAVNSHFTGLYNNWMGTSAPTAATPQVNAAAANSATNASNQSNLLAAIQSQIPAKYGGGTSGASVQKTFAGSLGAGWVTLTPGTGKVYNCAIYTASDGLAQTDVQSVTGVWSVADNYPKLLIARSKNDGTSYHYALIQSNTSTNNCQLGVVVSGVDHPLLTFALPGSGAFVANYNYTFHVEGRVLSIIGSSGLNQSVTDSGNLGMIGAAYRYGGFGTGGTSLGVSGWGGPNSGTWNPPAGMVAGDQYEIVGLGGAGGGGGGVNAWGNYGNGGAFNSILLTLGAGGVNPAVGAPINWLAGVGGAGGSSEYYQTYEVEYYVLGGNSGPINNTVYANYASSGADGGLTYFTWTGASGAQQLNCPQGTGGSYGGGAGGNSNAGTIYVNGDGYSAGANGGVVATNGSAPAYNGYNGNNWAGAGGCCYSGNGQTNVQSWYDQVGNHWYGYQLGVNGAQTAGNGAAGAAWITPISRQLPGSMSSWSFYDGLLVGPVSTVSSNITGWAGTAWTRSGAAVTANIGKSGSALVFLSTIYSYSNASGSSSAIGYDMVGANTVAVGGKTGVHYLLTNDNNPTPNCGAYLEMGLNPGSTTFYLDFLTSSASVPGNWIGPEIAIIPL